MELSTNTGVGVRHHALSSSYIYMRMLYMIHILYDIYVTLSPPFSLCSLLPFSFLTKMLSLNHPSAFLDRRRYYETYVRYVVFLGLAPAVCLNRKRSSLFLCLFVSFWLGFGSVNGCILAKSVLCAICWPVICLPLLWRSCVNALK